MERAVRRGDIIATRIFVTTHALFVHGAGARSERRRVNARNVGAKALRLPRGMTGTPIATTRIGSYPSEGQNVTRGIRDALMSVAAVIVLIAMLFLIDDRVRERFTGLAPEGIWDRIASEHGQLARAGAGAYEVIADHARLATFVVAGSVLVACMLRT